MGVTAGPSILSVLRCRDMRLLWPALLALFALAIVLGGTGGSLAAERYHAGVECLAPNGDDAAGPEHGPERACCTLACFGAPLGSPGLPGGDALALARLEPLRLAAAPVASMLPPPPAERRSEAPRGPPGAI